MRTRRRLPDISRLMLVALFFLPAGGAAAQSASQRSLIEQALDENSHIELEDVTIADAIHRIAEQTGVELRAAPRTLDLLPYGDRTRVSATIHNIPLRRGLDELLRPLGLRYEVADRRLDVRPTDPLLRLARPATWSELELLGRLHRDRWSEATARALSTRFLEEAAAHDPRTELLALARRESPGSLTDLLDALCVAHGWAWWPENDGIVVTDRARADRRLLTRRITLDRHEWTVTDLFAELAEAAGLPLHVEPGALLAVPRDAREHLSLIADNVTIGQVLEMVKGATGLDYELHEGALRIRATGVRSGAAPPCDDPIVGRIVVPAPAGGYHLEFFLRESDLPPELREIRRQRLHAARDAMERDFAQ